MQQLQLWGLVGTQEGPGLKAPKAILPLSSIPGASWRTERPTGVTPSLCQTEPRLSPGGGETRARTCPADPWRCLRIVLGLAGPPVAQGQQVCSRASRVQAPQLDSERDVKCAGSTAEPRSSARPPGSPGDSSKGFHWGTGGGCQGYETAVPQPLDSKDLARAVPSDNTSGGPLSCPDVTDAGCPGRAARLPSPSSHCSSCIWGGGGRVAGAWGQTQGPGPSGTPRSLGLGLQPNTSRVPGTDWRLRAPLGGQGRGLRGDGWACGRRRQAENTGRSSEPQGGQEPCVF